MSAKPIYQLEQFCAVLSSARTPLLARTPGVHSEQIAECRRLAYLLPPDHSDDQMPSALGLFRGDTIDYILARSHRSAKQTPEFHYIFLPSAVLESLRGDLSIFKNISKTPFPSFSTQQADLLPYNLTNDEAESDKTLGPYSALDALMTYCRSDMKLISKLLSLLIQGATLDVVDTPPSLKDQLTFVQGLLYLLPLSLRPTITFAIGAKNADETNAQIRFLTSAGQGKGGDMLFNWGAARLTGEVSDDTYSRYIIAQFRLDPSLALDQAEKLVYSASSTDMLENTLSKLSKRASLDLAMQSGLPVDHTVVAEILRKDQTLSEELQIAYCNYLLAFALALDEPDEAEIVFRKSEHDLRITEAISTRLLASAGTLQAGAVFHLLEGWLTETQNEDNRHRWLMVLGAAAVTHTQALVRIESPMLHEFLGQVLDLPLAPELRDAVMQIIDSSSPLGFEHRNVRHLLLSLSAKYLSDDQQHHLLQRFADKAWMQSLLYSSNTEIQGMITTELFISQLPHELYTALKQISSPDGVGSPDVLISAADAYGADYHLLMLARLLELARLNRHADMIDSDALDYLLGTVTEADIQRFGDMFAKTIQELSVVRDQLNKRGMVNIPPAPPESSESTVKPSLVSRLLPIIAFVIISAVVVLLVVLFISVATSGR